MLDVAFKNLLHLYRSRMGWTQQKVAEILEVPLDSYHRWENGEGYPSNDILQRMTNVFELNHAEVDQLYLATAYPPRLPWAGKQVPTARVNDELAHLWRMSSDSVRTSQNVNVRTSVLNLIVCVSDIESAQRASTLIRDLSSTHIARVTILILDSDAPDMVATWITTRSFPVISDVTRHTFEQVTLMAHGSAVRSIAHIAQPLIKPHLPVYLWWLNDLPNNPALFEALSKLSNRIIVDSSSFIMPEESMRVLATLAKTFPESGLSDLNWGRITPWRELLARFFDAAEYRPYLAGLHTIEIEHAAGPFAEPTHTEQGDVSPNTTCALLFAGWLKMQLGWHYAPDNPNAKDTHDAATGTHTWHMIRPTGALATPSSSTNGNKSPRTSSRTQASLHVRPRVRSDLRSGSLCLVRMTSIAGNKRAVFTINREDNPDRVLTSVALENETRPQRTVSMAVTRKLSALLHDELEIISRDSLYEETLQEVFDLLLVDLQQVERTQTPQSISKVGPPDLTTAIKALIRNASDVLQLLPETVFNKTRDFSASKDKQVIPENFNEKQQIRHLELALKNAGERGLAPFQTLQELVHYSNVLNVLFKQGTDGNILCRELLRLFALFDTPDAAKLNEIYSHSLGILSLQSPSDVDVMPYLSSFFNAFIAELYVDPFFRQQLSDVLQLRAAQNMHRSLGEIVSALYKVGNTIVDYYTPQQF